MTTKLAKHTPGPWKWDTDKVAANGELEPEETGWFHQGPDLTGLDDQCVLTSWGHDADGINVSAANARLIAAAPAMLEALELVRMSLGWQYLSAESKLVINNAICAAVGAQEENTQ